MNRRARSGTDSVGKRSESKSHFSTVSRLKIAESLAASFFTAATNLHEVAGVLGAMAGVRLRLSEILRRKVDPSVRSEVESVLDQYDVFHRRAVRLLSEMLDGRQSLSARGVVCNPKSVIEAQIATYRPILEANAIRIEHNLAEADRKVAVDGSVLAYVTRILLNNSVDAVRGTTRTQRRIVLAARTRPPNVEIDVADTGTGVGRAIREALFSAFTTTKPKASGIGLYWARAALKDFGASIDLLSSKVGHGASFRITLPLAVVVRERKR